MKSYKEFLTEALTISQYREIHKRLGPKFKKMYNDWFGDAQRLYLEMGKQKKAQKLAPPNEVVSLISKAGYKIEDYQKGLATKDGKNLVRIGKILQKLDNGSNPEISKAKKIFDERLKGQTTKSSEGNLIVISRHPYDIAGMSTGRGWTSCKNLVDGENKHYVPMEIEAGVLVAYEIDKNDLNITRPKGRMLIVPYQKVIGNQFEDETILIMSDKVYGSVSSKFEETVQAWLDSKQGEKEGSYCLRDDVYDDSYLFRQTRIKPRSLARFETETEKFGYFLNMSENGEYDKETKSITVFGSFYLEDYVKMANASGITLIKNGKLNVKFGEALASFSCQGLGLVSLEGCPNKVGGWFHCHNNKLTSLKDGPSNVYGSYDCSNNQLVSLEGAPIEIFGNFDCSDNKLQSLEGSPEYVKRTFNCGKNYLSSVEGGPKEVGEDLICVRQNIDVRPINKSEIKKFIKVGGNILL